MKKSRLLRSVLIISLFYWLVTIAVFSFYTPDRIAVMLDALPPFMAKAAGDLRPVEETNFLIHSGPYQLGLARAWTAPILVMWALAIMLGCLLAGLKNRLDGENFTARVKKRPGFRGMESTLWEVPLPVIPTGKPVEISIKSIELNAREQALLNAIMGVIAAHKDHFCGDGHGVGLLQHTVNVLKQTAKSPTATPNMLLVSAAHDIGKITAFQYSEEYEEWVRVKRHSDESARILGSLPEWRALPEKQREAIRLAVKFDHAPEKMPLVDNPKGTYELARSLISTTKKFDEAATAEEKQAIKETLGDLSEYAFQAFFDAIPRLLLHVRGTPKGSQTCGLKTGRRLYLFEGFLRQQIEGTLSPDISAALGTSFRRRGEPAEFTYYLMKGLHSQGWLVTSMDLKTKEGEVKTRSMHWSKAFWDIKSGNQNKNGVIIVDVPEEHMHQFPEEDSQYTIEVKNERPVDTRRAFREHGTPIPDDDAPKDKKRPSRKKDATRSGRKVKLSTSTTQKSSSKPVAPNAKTKAPATAAIPNVAPVSKEAPFATSTPKASKNSDTEVDADLKGLLEEVEAEMSADETLRASIQAELESPDQEESVESKKSKKPIEQTHQRPTASSKKKNSGDEASLASGLFSNVESEDRPKRESSQNGQAKPSTEGPGLEGGLFSNVDDSTGQKKPSSKSTKPKKTTSQKKEDPLISGLYK